MKHFATLALGAALAAVSPLAASAASLNDRGGSEKDPPVVTASHPVNWTGIYIGGQIGYGNANHKLEESYWYTEKGEDGPVTETYSEFLDGINSHGIFGGGTVGADIQRGHWLFGVFGDYNLSALKTTVGGTGSPDIDIIEEGDSWLIAARAGYLFGEEKRALIYVLGGYGQTDVTYRGIGEEGGDKDVTFSGVVLGAGAEYALTQNIFIGLEYQHFFGGEETLFAAGDALNGFKATDEMDTDKVMVKVKAKLGAGLGGLQ